MFGYGCAAAGRPQQSVLRRQQLAALGYVVQDPVEGPVAEEESGWHLDRRWGAGRVNGGPEAAECQGSVGIAEGYSKEYRILVLQEELLEAYGVVESEPGPPVAEEEEALEALEEAAAAMVAEQVEGVDHPRSPPRRRIPRIRHQSWSNRYHGLEDRFGWGPIPLVGTLLTGPP